MANQLHIEAEDGRIIQINQAELRTESGKEWLEQQLKKHRKQTQSKVKKCLND